MVLFTALALLLLVSHALESSSADADANDTRGTPEPANLSSRIRILFPINDSVNALPLRFNCEIPVTTNSDFMRAHGDDLFCIEVNRSWRQCEPVATSRPLLRDLPAGNYSATVYLASSDLVQAEDSGPRTMESEIVRFELAPHSEFWRRVEKRKDEERARVGIQADEDLLAWAAKPSRSVPTISGTSQLSKYSADLQLSVSPPATHSGGASSASDPTALDTKLGQLGNSSATLPPLLLLIGVKTSVLHNFAARQAIRSTWGLERALDRLGIKLLFVGCTPVFHNTDADKREALERAIEREKREFRDLFTHELACTDSYATLPDKVKQFFHYAATAHATIPYVMVADDDIYLQVAELARALREHGPRSRFYAGQVWTKQFLAHMLPNRDPDSKNFVSEGQYPMRFLPPFAFGPHFLLSMDCVEYIAENRDVLGNLSSLDDVSVALWLLALQVHPEHIPSFRNLRGAPCSEGLVSLADLSPFAIRIVHANVQSNASMCRGFDHASWLRGD